VSVQAVSTSVLEGSDGVSLAVYDFGGSGDTLVVSHATGFHAHCYVDLIDVLRERFHVVGLDYRGHGSSSEPNTRLQNWRDFADDLRRVCRHVSPDAPVRVFGHSMGAAAALMVSEREPALIASAVLFEPITPPPAPGLDPESIPLVIGARRRRATFPDRQTAIDNYGSKPPLSLMTPSTLRAYVEFGTRAIADGVELSCRPDFEGDTFVGAHALDVWSRLDAIELTCLVLAGADEEGQPSSFAGPVADRLPQAQFRRLEHQTHFGPFSHPDEVAAIASEFLGGAS
jgi:pimeloyl-ACP methyl ester carboxylesterase